MNDDSSKSLELKRPRRNRRAPVLYGAEPLPTTTKIRRGRKSKRSDPSAELPKNDSLNSIEIISDEKAETKKSKTDTSIPKHDGSIASTHNTTASFKIMEEIVSRNINLSKTNCAESITQAIIHCKDFAKANKVSIEIQQPKEDEAKKENKILNITDLLEADMAAEKDDNDEDDENMPNPLTPLPTAQVVPSTPSNAKNNVYLRLSEKNSALRTPPAGILRNPDSPRIIGRRVHFDVDTTNEDNTSSMRKPKFGPLSPTNNSPLSKLMPNGSLSPSTSKQIKTGTNSPTKRRLILEASKENCSSPPLKRTNLALQNSDLQQSSSSSADNGAKSTSHFAFMPEYVDITDAIRLKICQMLAPSTGSKDLQNQLKMRGIFTVGDLAGLSEADISQLTIKAQPTKIIKARSVITSLYSTYKTAKLTPAFDINTLASENAKTSITACSGDSSAASTPSIIPLLSETIPATNAEYAQIISLTRNDEDGKELPIFNNDVQVEIIENAESTSFDSVEISLGLSVKGVENATSLIESTTEPANEAPPLAPLPIADANMELSDTDDFDELPTKVQNERNELDASTLEVEVIQNERNELDASTLEADAIIQTSDVIQKLSELGELVEKIDDISWNSMIDNAALGLLAKLTNRMDRHRKMLLS